jgi:hypothetical protein
LLQVASLLGIKSYKLLKLKGQPALCQARPGKMTEAGPNMNAILKEILQAAHGGPGAELAMPIDILVNALKMILWTSTNAYQAARKDTSSALAQWLSKLEQEIPDFTLVTKLMQKCTVVQGGDEQMTLLVLAMVPNGYCVSDEQFQKLSNVLCSHNAKNPSVGGGGRGQRLAAVGQQLAASLRSAKGDEKRTEVLRSLEAYVAQMAVMAVNSYREGGLSFTVEEDVEQGLYTGQTSARLVSSLLTSYI